MTRRLFLVVWVVILWSTRATAQDNASGDYFVQASVDNPTPFVGQQIIYTFRLYDAVGLDNPLYEPSDFEGFWRIDLGGISQHVEQLNGRQYTVSEIKTVLFPTRFGMISIASAGILLPDTVFQAKRELKANPIIIQVKRLPENAPDNFSGAVGQFQMGLSLDRQSIKLGEPITLRLTVTGNGNVEQLSLPSTSFSPAWQVYENPSTYTATQEGNQVIGNKVYELVIFPNAVGLQTLPAIAFSYFDPGSFTYRLVSSDPVQIEVISGDYNSSPASVTGQLFSLTPALKPIAVSSENTHDYSGLDTLLLWLIPPLVVIAGWGWRYYQRYTFQNRLAARQLQALRLAQKGLDNARKFPVKEACLEIKQVVRRYIADKVGLAFEINISHGWQQEVSTIPSPISQQLQLCIELVDQELYAPDSELEIKALIERVRMILSDVDRSWKTS